MALSRRAVETSRDSANTDLLLGILRNLWDAETNPDGYVSLGIAENSLMSDVLIKHMQDHMDIPRIALTYGDGFTRIRNAAARFLNKHFKPVCPIKADHIHISNGVTPAIQDLAWAIGNPGDGILLGRPYYVSFLPDVKRRTDVEIVAVSFGDVDPLGTDGLAKYEEEILKAEQRGQRIAGLIVAHPHNPLGKCYPRETLIGMMRLCQKYQIHLVSDEIYALSVFDNKVDEGAAATPFESILSIDPEGIIDPRLVHVLWGMSKDFGANGLRVGMTISQHSSQMRDALKSVFEFSWMSSLSELVTANALEDDEWVESYISENRRKLSERQEKVLLWAQRHGIEYTPGANAGFFVWVNLGGVYQEHHPDVEGDLGKTVMQALLDNKVFLADGTSFGSEKPGWFRIVFSQELPYLEEGLRRIIATVKGE